MSSLFGSMPDIALRYEQWDEDNTPFRHRLRLDASSYRPERIFDTPPVLAEEGGHFVVSPHGTFAYQNRILPEGRSLRLLGKQQGKVVWNGDVVLPALIDTRRQCRTGEWFPADTPLEERVMFGAVWMSLTPMEMMTQRSGVKMARGTVVIGGLGLGWLLRKVCEKSEVERVVVVEKSRELLDWYGYSLCGQLGKVSDVVCDDIYNQIGKHGPWARYLLDIWPTYACASRDDRLVPVRSKLKRLLWAWGLD